MRKKITAGLAYGGPRSYPYALGRTGWYWTPPMVLRTLVWYRLPRRQFELTQEKRLDCLVCVAPGSGSAGGQVPRPWRWGCGIFFGGGSWKWGVSDRRSLRPCSVCVSKRENEGKRKRARETGRGREGGSTGEREGGRERGREGGREGGSSPVTAHPCFASVIPQ
eukprot:132697-Rhodomonas_salina.2